jgi:hypothetical protein
VTFRVLSAESMKKAVFGDVALCSFVETDLRNVGQFLRDYTAQIPEDSHLQQKIIFVMCIIIYPPISRPSFLVAKSSYKMFRHQNLSCISCHSITMSPAYGSFLDFVKQQTYRVNYIYNLIVT